MSNIDSFLARKYDIMGQQAASAATEATARAGLLQAQTDQLPANDAARRANEFASAGVSAAQAKSIGVNSQLAQDAAPTDIMAKTAQIGSTTASTALTNEQTKAAAIGNQPGSPQMLRLLAAYQGVTIPNSKLAAAIANQPIGTGSSRIIGTVGSSVLDDAAKQKVGAGIDALNAGTLPAFGFSGGTGRVPGKGSGKVDTVPAMLAPGEAVLNKEAAERLGRGTIDVLNAVGLHERGQVGSGGGDAQGQPAGVLHAAKGTSKVGGARKAAAKPVPPGINPGVLNAIMGG